ncbi:MAG: sulfatase-like hydrolase/transferase [Hydrogenophaga sp.]|uniref:sulfatase-like hydrolase/transferase n=1 Tax=Hydrogenophaga sp. TaxID=1904254 RepID=UPI0026036382|nr:sulfatase-like hydrolase/transferase [Hydrogenophaga sp.]MCW5669868.1 sulfatase-like hydrolase/transferase [Hydrogenophaga sp.]
MHALSRPGWVSGPLRSSPATWLLGLLTLTLLWDLSGLDMASMRAIGSPEGFALQDNWLLSRVLHDGLRQVMTGFWLLLLAWACWPGGRLPRRERWTVVALATLSLLAVNLVKNASQTSCPWDLQAYGGAARWVSHWAWGVADGGPGRCFPGGHASSGFAFIGLCLPWLDAPRGTTPDRLRATGLRWLAAVLFVGLLAGAVQTLRGAHFPSHTLWTLLMSAAVSWVGWRVAQPWLTPTKSAPRAPAVGPAERPPRRPLATHILAVLRPLLMPMACMLAVLWLSRAGLAWWQADRIAQAQAGPLVWWEGLRFDAVLMGLAWVLPATLTPWMATRPGSQRAWSVFLRVYGGIAVLLVVFMELATPAFVLQYDSRPNYLFVEYLGYAKEVGGTLLKDYGAHLLATAVLLPCMGWAYARLTRPAPSPPGTLRIWQALLLSVLCFLVLALCARGALGHRPANPATAAVTTDHLVNELPLSSLYTVTYAIYQSRKAEEGGITYAEMPQERVIDIVRRETGLPPSAFTDPASPLRHPLVSQHPRERPLNLVIVLEESLGAEFVGRLGGLPLTPHLDRLGDEGIWFDNLYATGTRSVRGIEAVVAGFPPTSAVSTVKLARSQRDFFTLASFLKPKGYESTFFYGGESHFDNMRSYFMGNGFDRVVEQKDMPAGAFMATWGASDGDLLDVAHERFSQQPADKPFFALVFSSSNHAPFEFPDGGFELYEQPKNTVNNAVKYADHALGRFFEKAKKSAYWDNTLFLVVADHNSRVYGPSVIPIERFHIPGVILGGAVRSPERIRTVASQIDLAPTLISMMGLSGDVPLTGRDLSDPAQRARPGRAILQFDKIQAYMEGSSVAVLQPDSPPRVMSYLDGQLKDSTESQPALVEKAQTHARYTQWAYQKQWHR